MASRQYSWIRILIAASCFLQSGQAASSTAHELVLRGITSHREGDLNTAAAAIDEALTELERSTADPALVNVALTELTFVRIDQGQLADAERLSRKALAICRARGEEGAPARIVASGNLALVLIEGAKYTEADALTSTAVEEAASVFGSRSKQYANLLAIQGSISMGRDHFTEAIRVLRQATAIMEDKQSDRDELGRAYQNLAAAAAQAGKTKLALASLNRARETWLSSLPEGHPALIDEQNTLICIYLKSGKYREAYATAMSLLPLAEKIFGSNNPRFAVILNNAGMICEHEGQEAQAVAAFRRAHEINLRALGPMHPNTAYALLNYGRATAKDGHPTEGTSLQHQATALLNTLH